jgi:hypothetical protein
MNTIDEEEIWLPVAEPRFNNYYEISNKGNVKSLAKYIENSGNFSGGYHKKIKDKKHFIDHSGYCITKLCIDGKCLNRKIHRLVAEAFIPNPEGKEQVNHIDGNKENNSVENLEWVTRSENIKHAFSTGLMTNDHLKGSNNKLSKVDEATVIEIRHLYDNKLVRFTDILNAYPQVSKSMLQDIIKRRTWKNI